MKRLLFFFFVLISYFPVLAELDDRFPIYENVSYTQGQNNYGALGTCGPASVANAMNLITQSTDYTENMVIERCLRDELCELVDHRDGQKAVFMKRDFMLTHFVWERTMADKEHNYNVFLHDSFPMCIDRNNDKKCLMSVSEEMAQYMENFLSNFKNSDIVGVAAVNAGALFYDEDVNIFSAENPWDHVITVVGPLRNANGTLIGFSIVDSGNIQNFVDPLRFAKSFSGTIRFITRRDEIPEQSEQKIPVADFCGNDCIEAEIS